MVCTMERKCLIPPTPLYTEENDENIASLNNRLNKSYFTPLNDTKPVMTACASSTINLDSLLANIECKADKELRSSMTVDTSACTTISSSTNSLVSSSSMSNFLTFSSERRNKGRMLRSARFSSHLSALSAYSSDDDSVATSLKVRKSSCRTTLPENGSKRTRDDVEENWGHFVDHDSSEQFDIDFKQGNISAVLDESAWGYFADTSD